jgi:hypothetical protein
MLRSPLSRAPAREIESILGPEPLALVVGDAAADAAARIAQSTRKILDLLRRIESPDSCLALGPGPAP